MKTVFNALIDEVIYPIPEGLVENVLIRRGLDFDESFTSELVADHRYIGALADCLYSLLQSINFSESDKSIGALTDQQRKALLARINKLYGSIGEDEVVLEPHPTVYINC